MAADDDNDGDEMANDGGEKKFAKARRTGVRGTGGPGGVAAGSSAYLDAVRVNFVATGLVWATTQPQHVVGKRHVSAIAVMTRHRDVKRLVRKHADPRTIVESDVNHVHPCECGERGEGGCGEDEVEASREGAWAGGDGGGGAEAEAGRCRGVGVAVWRREGGRPRADHTFRRSRCDAVRGLDLGEQVLNQ